MPKGYVIVRAEVTNPDKWAEYVTKSKVALDKFGGLSPGSTAAAAPPPRIATPAINVLESSPAMTAPRRASQTSAAPSAQQPRPAHRSRS